MRSALTVLLLIGLAAGSVPALGAEHPALKAFPSAPEGVEHFVIVLPHKERGEDEAFRVEIMVGKEVLTDGVNLVRLGGTIEPRTLTGWGYTYYEVTGPSAAMSTMMAPPPGAPMVQSFVAASPLHVRYNSRLPIVVYVPRGYEVRYRIWQAPETAEKAERGEPPWPNSNGALSGGSGHFTFFPPAGWSIMSPATQSAMRRGCGTFS